METQLVNAMSREKILANLLKDVKKDYDYILIDCMPSLGMITINALTAADSVIIPVQAQYLPAKGMTQLMRSIDMVRNHTNENLKIAGIVMTLVDSRTNLSKEVINTIRTKYGMSIRNLNDVYAAFADEVRKQGYQPMLYSSKIFLETIWSEKTKKSTPWQEKNTDYCRPTQAVPKEMPYCCHTDAILMPYLRVWLHYGYTMASVWQVLGKDLASAWEKLGKGLGKT